MGYGVVVMGSSWGGLYALRSILADLPGDFDVPIVIAQHQAQDPDADLARSLQARSSLAVEEVRDKTRPEPGHAYLAPADYHTLLDDGMLTLSTDRLVHYSRPSIDVLFESAADSFGAGVIGVIMTGANRDGARGLKAIKDNGGFTIVQDPATASQATMPQAAIDAVRPHRTVSLEEIPKILADVVARSSRGAPV